MTEAQMQIYRLVPFFGVLILMGMLELLFPRRALSLSKLKRWSTNLAIVFIDTLVIRLTLPMTVIAVAYYAEKHGIGLLNSVVGLPLWARMLGAMVALDFIIYLQHVMFHAVPLLWRFHMMHHADMDYDVTLGLRFHPVEIFISAWIKIGAVLLLGAPALAVFFFEIILNACAMFNHSNFRLPLVVDRFLRLILVTPDMHRVHHSIFSHETNSNFGFNLPFWDRIFGTYTAQPRAGHEKMKIGLEQFRHAKVARLGWVLAAPFYEKTGHYTINAISED